GDLDKSSLPLANLGQLLSTSELIAACPPRALTVCLLMTWSVPKDWNMRSTMSAAAWTLAWGLAGSRGTICSISRPKVQAPLPTVRTGSLTTLRWVIINSLGVEAVRALCKSVHAPLDTQTSSTTPV